MNAIITIKALREDGFGSESFYKCLVAEIPGEQAKLIGYCLYYYVYSTFDGKSSYLEDLYVRQEYRGHGVGTALWKQAAKEVLKKGCKRMDFVVLSWNTKAGDFYLRQGAVNMTLKNKWELWRMEDNALKQFAENS